MRDAASTPEGNRDLEEAICDDIEVRHGSAAKRQELAPFFADKVPDASLLYGAAVGYLLKRGWRRMEIGSGWWWREGFEEATVGAALDQQLEADGIDFRTALIGEPEEFCG